MAKLRVLDTLTGVEQIIDKIDVNGFGDIIGVNILQTANGGVVYVKNDNTEKLDVRYSNDSTEDLNLYIENTKATLEDGDILVYNETNSTFKVDNISNYVSGGGGNTYTISLPFSKGGGNVDGTVIVPENAVLLFAWLKINNELSTGGAPFQIRLAGSSPLVIAEQGIDFDELVGEKQAYRFDGAIGGTLDGLHVVTSTDSGVLQANHTGSGYGDGIIYLQYSTALS